MSHSQASSSYNRAGGNHLKEENLHIAFFPAGDENTASSRIRVFSTIRVLKKKGIPFTLGDSPDANVFYVQKRVTPEILKIARAAKRRGRIVIYEIDDFGPAMTYWVTLSLFRKMVRLSDVVITAGQEQQELLRVEHGVQDSIVLPPCVDYYPEQPVQTPLNEGHPFRILWFGSSGNFHLVQRYIDDLLQLRDVQLVFCMEKGAENLVSKYERTEFIPWTLSGFVPALQSCQLTCLAHGGNKINLAKTNNKMITSITWGVPAVVSRTPQYVKTAIEAKIEDAVFSNGKELLEAVQRLGSPAERQKYLRIAQPAIWNIYSPETITDRFLEIIRGIQKEGALKRSMRIFTSLF